MRPYLLSILFIFMLQLAGTSAWAQASAPAPQITRLPNIKASIDDGFFSLAEQQARGVLRSEPNAATEREAALLLAQALWGQKRYSETLTLLAQYSDDPGFIYWRARANFELKQNDVALKLLIEAAEGLANSHYAPATLRLKGHIEQIEHQSEAAEATFRQFAKTFPEHSECIENQFDLATVLILQKKIPEAIEVYKALEKEQDPNAVQRAQLKLGHVLYTQGAAENMNPARSLFDGVATNSNARLAYRIDAYVDLAALEEKAGDKTASVSALRKAIELSPDALQRVPLRLALARMLLRNGDTTGALRLLEQCRAEAPNEIVAAELQLEKGNALLQAKKFAEADDAYQVYLDVADDAAGLAHAYFGKGLALWELARYTESATAFDKVGQAGHPIENEEALFKAGDAYYKAGNFIDAEKRYRAFITAYPEHAHLPNALYQHGLSLAKIDRRTEALATFATVEADHAGSPFAEMAALGSADVMRAGEQWEAALTKYTQVRETYPNGPAAVLSLHQRGMLLYQLGRFADARKDFEEVLAKYPESSNAPQASYMRGFCLYLLGATEEAVETCLTFIHEYPDSPWTPEVIFWLAEQYYNQGDYAKSEPLFVRIATDFKANTLAPRALYRAGRAAAAQANYVVAIERYSALAKTYPESDVLPQTRFAHGDALSELGEFSRGILAFEEIIKNYPENDLVSSAWGRKGDCQFSLASENPARYANAMNSYQAILDRSSASPALRLQAEYKVGRCLEKTNVPDRAFNRYMSVVYTFINENSERSRDSVLWFTRSAFGAAALKEKEHGWVEAVAIYQRVIEADVPAKDEAGKRIEKIKQNNWLLFEQVEEKK